MTVIAVSAVRAAVVAALNTGSLSGRVYVGRGPETPESAVPYVVVYTQPPMLDGPAGDPHADANLTVQVKAVGNGFGACEAVGDIARSALLSGFAAPSGYVFSGPVVANGGQPARPDEDTTGPLWMADELFDLPLTPA